MTGVVRGASRTVIVIVFCILEISLYFWLSLFGVDDLCFHTYGEFSPSPSSPPPSLSPLLNPCHMTQIPVFRPLLLLLHPPVKSQSQGPNSREIPHVFYRPSSLLALLPRFFLLFSANWVILGPFLNPWRDLFCTFLIHILLLNIFQTKPAPKFLTNLLSNSKNNRVNSH